MRASGNGDPGALRRRSSSHGGGLSARGLSARGLALEGVLMALIATSGLGASAAAQEDPPPEEAAGLSEAESEAAEAEVMRQLPQLAPEGSASRTGQLRALADQLTARRAYCRAAAYLDELRALGEVDQSRSAAAQVYYQCARTRLHQGDPDEAAARLAVSIEIVGERPEHRELQFKLALVRAKRAMDSADLEAVREGLRHARALGVDMGPGANDRLADWALPVLHDAATQVARWSLELLEQDRRDLADQASRLALEFHPRETIALQVQRQLAVGGGLPLILGGGLGVLLVGGFLWRLWRWRQLRRVAAGEGWDDGVGDLEAAGPRRGDDDDLDSDLDTDLEPER